MLAGKNKGERMTKEEIFNGMLSSGINHEIFDPWRDNKAEAFNILQSIGDSEHEYSGQTFRIVITPEHGVNDEEVPPIVDVYMLAEVNPNHEPRQPKETDPEIRHKVLKAIMDDPNASFEELISAASSWLWGKGLLIQLEKEIPQPGGIFLWYYQLLNTEGSLEWEEFGFKTIEDAMITACDWVL